MLFACTLVLFLAGCGGGGVKTPSPTEIAPSPSPLPATPTPIPPTPTPEPLAARVNGEAITLAEYQAELARYQAASGTSAAVQPPEDESHVLDDLIALVLLAQGAAEAGFHLDEAGLQARLDALVAQLGSSQALQDWIAAHGYTEQDFRRALARQAAAAWMRDKIIANVPENTEQVHARQILLYNLDQANQVLAQVRAGTDFATLASEYDPIAGGDLGWFPRGYLTVPELDQAVFSLQAGQVSDVIQTRLGFHIVQVIERDPAHPLEPSARLALQSRALQDWLAQRRSQSQIEVLLP